MSVRSESQNHATVIFSNLTVFLALRYHYEYYVTSENHCFDLRIGKLSENKDRKRLVRFFPKRHLVVINRDSMYNFVSNYSFTLLQHYDDDVIAEIYHFELKNEFYGENKDRKILVRIKISVFFIPQNWTFSYH